MTEISGDTAPPGNIHEYTVSEVSQAVKRTLEGAFEHVRVRGEVGRPNYHSSGHLYFTVKDEGAVLDGVCWRGTVGRLNLRLEEGMEVVCTGRISSYPKSSRYQIVVEAIELAGEGALLKLLEDRRKKLAAEGLFDAERKQPIPFLPDVIGVVTSPTGAVIRDILHRLADRFPRRVMLWPVRVQGDGAADEIAAAIEGFNRLAPGGAVPRPDVLIVGRGGGSLEDLWAFNEEVVVRAAAGSVIPLISAVGHETDTTLIDFAADLRAPTPTAAAEMAVPVRAELLAQVIDDQRRMVAAMARRMDQQAIRLEGLARGLPDPHRLLEAAYQTVDGEADRLRNAVRNLVEARSSMVARLGAELRHPREMLSLRAQSLDQLALRIEQAKESVLRTMSLRFEGLAAAERLRRGAARALADSAARVDGLGKLLQSLSYERVLERGYAVVHDAAGVPVTRAAAAIPGAEIGIQFADGTRGATVHDGDGPKPPPAGRKRTRRGKPGDDTQGSLL